MPGTGGQAVLATPRRRTAAIVFAGVVLAVGSVVAVTVAKRGQVHEVAAPLPVVAAAGATSESAPDPTIVVSVIGTVARPGLVTLPEGARVADALSAAGGPALGTDISVLNLARRLTDGEQVAVGVPAPAAGEPTTSGTPGRVDLNTATLAQLDTLPGVGAVTAQRIVDWRTKHGRFTDVGQLRDVDGIGASKFTKLRELVTVR